MLYYVTISTGLVASTGACYNEETGGEANLRSQGKVGRGVGLGI